MAQQTISSGAGVYWDDEKDKINSNFTEVYNHTTNTSNPHSVDEDDILPSQTGNSGKYLTTDGTNSSWGTVSATGMSWSVVSTATNAVTGNGYLVDCSGGTVTVTLPSSPSAGNIVAVIDGSSDSGTNNITIARNGSNIEGAASNMTIDKDGYGVTLVYMNATRGWVRVYEVNTVNF